MYRSDCILKIHKKLRFADVDTIDNTSILSEIIFTYFKSTLVPTWFYYLF